MKKYWEKKPSKALKRKKGKGFGNPNPKLPEVKSPKKYMKGKRGQMFIIGIFMLIIALIIFIATLPAISELVNNSRGCGNLNCAGWVDKDSSAATCGSTNTSYRSDLETNTLSCTIIDLFVPFLILGVLMAGIIKLIYDKLHKEPTEAPPYYGGGY